MKLLTRREVIESWKNQDDNFLDSFCCPNCRDIMFHLENNEYLCKNEECANCDLIVKEEV